eukprot:363547_1
MCDIVCPYIDIFYYFVLSKCTVSTLKTTYNSLYFYFPIKPSLFVYDHETKHVMMSMQLPLILSINHVIDWVTHRNIPFNGFILGSVLTCTFPPSITSYFS